MNSKKDIAVIFLCWLSGIVIIFVMMFLTGYLAMKGWNALNFKLIFGSTNPLSALLFKKQVFDGLFPSIIGTLLLIICSVGFAVPLGLITGIYMAEYANNFIKIMFGLFFDILASIPSILIGLFGFSLAVFLHKHVSENIYPCLLISCLSLGLLILPYIIRTTQISLESLSLETRVTALSLGATKLQNLYHILLPRSFSGIMSGVILAIGRCAEDTAVIMLTGVVASAGIPKSLFSKFEALPFYIYYISSQYTSPEELANGYGASIILLTICAFLFVFAFVIQKSLHYRALYCA